MSTIQSLEISAFRNLNLTSAAETRNLNQTAAYVKEKKHVPVFLSNPSNSTETDRRSGGDVVPVADDLVIRVAP